MKQIMMIGLALSSFFTVAGDRISQNEDVQYIRDYHKAERAAALVDVLQLDAAQIETLKAIKADLDAIKADSEVERAEFEERVAAAAAIARAEIEATGEMSEANQAIMEELKIERHQIRSDKRTRMKAAAIGLRDFLTDEQKQALKESMRAMRSQRIVFSRESGGEARMMRQQRKSRGDEGSKSRERGRDRIERKLSRLLLSDAFINALDGE